MPTAKLISITPNYMELLQTAAGKCYDNKCGATAIQHIIDAGHLSVLEHCYASFEVECSVRVLGQLTRHRHLSFTVQSSRGTKVEGMITPNVKGLFECEADVYDYSRIRDTLHESLFKNYNEALDNGMAFEDAAYMLPQGATTKMVVTGNFRAWFEYLPKRLCLRALQEHKQLARIIQSKLSIAAPEIFDRNFLQCDTCKEKGCEFI